MAIFGISSTKINNPNIKLILFPTVLLLILVLLFVVLLQNGYQRISTELGDLENSRKTEILLVQKLESLKTIDLSILDKADITLIALPEKNSSNFFLTHVRRIGSEKGIVFSKIKTSSRPTPNADTNKAVIVLEFEVDEIDAVVDFLKEIRQVLPVTSIEKVEIASVAERKGAIATINIFWSDLPTQLPPITEPINALKNEERLLLSEIATYVGPEFVILDPNQPTERENPFN